MTPHMLMVDILNNACVSQTLEDGWNEYDIDVHCVSYTVQAKPRRRDGDGLPTDWDIRHMERKSN